MLQEPTVFAGVGIGIAEGDQPVAEAPALDAGIHLRWASTPARGFPRHGHYLLRRRTPQKGVPLESEDGESLVAGVETNFAGTGDGGGPWIEVRFVDRSFVTRVDVTFDPGQSSGTTLTAFTDGVAVDTQQVGPGTIDFRHVELAGEYVTALRIQGDFSLLKAIRVHALAIDTQLGWTFVPDADVPLSAPLVHDDYPASTAPTTLADARTMAADRIAYGAPERYAPSHAPATAPGTVSVQRDSPFVTGSGTAWTDAAVGDQFRVAATDDVYTVLSVLAADRLLLSRAYTDASASGQSYTLAADSFGSIHDALATLVTGGPGAGGMGARAIPEAVETGGTISAVSGETGVTGQGTAWSTALEGLDLQMAHATAGTVDLQVGETVVTGQGTAWDDSLEGSLLVPAGERTRYEVVAVNGPAELEVDRPYAGPASGSVGYDLFDPDAARIDRVLNATTLELAEPFPGPTAGGRAYRIVGSMTAPGADEQSSVSLPAQYPLETLLLAGLDPAMSQLLGSYWVDSTVEPDVAYDYLLVADHTGAVDTLMTRLGVDATTTSQNAMAPFVSWVIYAAHVGAVDAYIVDNLEQGVTDPPAPPAPTAVRAYDLPERPVSPSGAGPHAAGIGWQHAHTEDRLPLDTPLVHYLWRTSLGDDPGTTSPAVDGYGAVGHTEPVTDLLSDADPVLVTASSADANSSTAIPGWPTAPIHVVDSGRSPGWYSYRVNGMDLFGRHSALSEPGTWHDPETDSPTAHDAFPAAPDFAVELRTRLPPPPPTGITATVLDPQDPDLTDSEAVAWWDSHGEQVALRIEWAWPARLADQAPETDAFECYVEIGSLNSHPGSVTGVTEGAETSRITTSHAHTVDPGDDTTDPLPPGAFAGCALQVAGAGFTVVDSGDAGGLWLDVLNRQGPDGVVLPAVGVDCALTVPPVYSRGSAVVVDGDDVVTGEGTAWSVALEGLPIRLGTTTETYLVSVVESPTRLRLDRPYASPPSRDDRDPADGPHGPHTEATTYAIDHPASTDYSDASHWSYRVDDVAIAADVVGRRTAAGDRFYETIVPAPEADGGGFDPGVGPTESPVVHANVGVCSRIDTRTDPLRGDVGGPAPVARVHRDSPPVPAVPPLTSEIDWATRPDYENASHYTVRWEKPPAGERVHVFRTMDRTLFRVDWDRRQSSSAFTLSADDTDAFPPTLRGTDPAETQRREEIVTTLTTDLDVPSFADAEAVYASLDPDELQTLAGLPGVESAFSQLTTDPLTASDAPNVEAPDFEAGDPGPGTASGSTLCAYVDRFDGRARNRYLYRVGSVDDAGNRSETLSYPTPPTQARDGVPPETPVVTSIVAGHPDDAEPGDRRITLRWNRVRSPDLVRYRVFRTDDAAATEDVRHMTEVATLVTPLSEGGDPLTAGRAESGSVVWTDDDRDADRVWHYRVVAEDAADNASRPSSAVGSRAFDTTPPTPPALTAVEWVRVGPDGSTQPYDDPVPQGESWTPAVRVAWDDPGDLRVQLEVTEGNPATAPAFSAVSRWRSDVELVHRGPRASETYQYRLTALDSRGGRATGSPTTVAPPGGVT